LFATAGVRHGAAVPYDQQFSRIQSRFADRLRTLVAILIAILAVSGPLAQGEMPFDQTKVTLQYEVLRLINRDRAKHKLPAVELDLQASSIAEAYCRTQIRNGTTGHFTTDGHAPYMRYSFAGGNDGVSENAAAWSASYNFSDRALYEMVRRSQEAMMGEVPPHDGHRRTILDPYATHVGIGLAWEKGEFRLAQEFVRRYIDWSRPLPRTATLDEQISASGRPLPGARVDAITVHYEPVPTTLAPNVANLISSYSLPHKRRDYLPRLKTRYEKRDDGTLRIVSRQYTDGRRGDFYVGEDGSFSFNVPFTDGAGIYTVVVWVRRNGDKTPIAASNISVRVDRRAASGPAYGTR
jgi:hypothetical protein